MLANISKATELIIVNNSSLPLDNIISSKSEKWNYVKGSNSNNEFSGWQEGIDHLSRNIESYDWVVFANDSIARQSSDCNRSSLLSLMPNALNQAHSADAIGLLHSRNKKYSGMKFLNKEIIEWLCTCSFAVTGKALRKITCKIDYSTDLAEMTSNCREGEFLSNSLEPMFKKHITDWLTIPGKGWYNAKAVPHSEEDLKMLRRKSLMIFNELLLYLKMKEAGLSVYDPTTRKVVSATGKN